MLIHRKMNLIERVNIHLLYSQPVQCLYKGQGGKISGKLKFKVIQKLNFNLQLYIFNRFLCIMA
jgi:hypothetical protein